MPHFFAPDFFANLRLMVTLDQLDCKVFIESALCLDELAKELAVRVRADLETCPWAAILRLPFAEFEIRENEDAAPDRAPEFPDGFLYFRYRLEMYVDPNKTAAEKIQLVTRILNYCWESGWSAVAACDYEPELSESGGYKSRNIPWPETAVELKV